MDFIDYKKKEFQIKLVCPFVVVIVVFVFFHRSANVAGREDREDEGLQKSNQQFDQVHERGEQTTDNCSRSGTANTVAVVAKQKDQAD